MNHPSVCQEMFRDLLLDLPLLSSPVILLCMNKELRKQCVGLLQRKPSRRYIEGGGNQQDTGAPQEPVEKPTQLSSDG